MEGNDGCCDVEEGVLHGLRSTESETAFSKASTSDSEDLHQRRRYSPLYLSGFFGMLKKRSGIKFQAFPYRINVPKIPGKKSKRITDTTTLLLNPPLDAELYCLRSSWKNFSLEELQNATNGFSPGLYLFSFSLFFYSCSEINEMCKGPLRSRPYPSTMRMTENPLPLFTGNDSSPSPSSSPYTMLIDE